MTIGQISDGLPVIEGWDPKDIPPPYHFSNPEPKGYEVHPLNRRYVLEVCPFRAWVLQLHHQKEYSIVNVHNQCLMSVLAYADGDVNVEDIETYGNAKIKWLRTYRPFLSGIPCRHPIARILRTIVLESLLEALLNWVNEQREQAETPHCL